MASYTRIQSAGIIGGASVARFHFPAMLKVVKSAMRRSKTGVSIHPSAGFKQGKTARNVYIQKVSSRNEAAAFLAGGKYLVTGFSHFHTSHGRLFGERFAKTRGSPSIHGAVRMAMSHLRGGHMTRVPKLFVSKRGTQHGAGWKVTRSGKSGVYGQHPTKQSAMRQATRIASSVGGVVHVKAHAVRGKMGRTHRVKAHMRKRGRRR